MNTHVILRTYQRSFVENRSKILLSLLFDLLALVAVLASFALSYLLVGYLYEFVSFRVNAILFAVLLLISLLISYFLLVTAVSCKYFSYRLWRKSSYKRWYRMTAFWLIPWTLAYLALVSLFEQGQSGYVLPLGFVVYSLTTSLLRWNLTHSFRANLSLLAADLRRAETWTCTGMIALTVLAGFFLLGIVFQLFQQSAMQSIVFFITTLILYLGASSWAKNYMYVALRK